jgi:dTDP-4-amino-4,6-dideoxygalactose transaminase
MAQQQFMDGAHSLRADPIPLFSPRLAQQQVRERVQRVLREVADSGEYILGPNVEAFERELAGWLGGGVGVVGVASGTDALYLALLAVGVGPQDEVITTPLSFVATAEAVIRVGARPVFCDVDTLDANLDPADVAARIGPRTRALLPVHLFGAPAAMDELATTAQRHGIPLVEDVAQALGGSWRGVALGTLGTAAAASFFPTKTLGAMGDAGAVICRDERLADRLRSLRFHGVRGPAGDGVYTESGTNSRLDALQAAVLRVKLGCLSEQLRERREIAAGYDAALSDHAHVRPLGCRPEGSSARGLYTVWVENGRDDLQRHLAERGISTRVYYPLALHLQPALRELGHRRGDLPRAEAATRSLLSLPLFPGMPPAWQQRVADGVRGWRPPVG